jgi:hypothetical protein
VFVSELSPARIIIITMGLHAHISPGGRIIGPLVAAALSLSLNPAQSVNRSISQSIDVCYEGI